MRALWLARQLTTTEVKAYRALYLILSLLYLLPVFMGMQFPSLADSPLSSAIQSHSFLVMVGGTLALSAPLSLDLFLDLFSRRAYDFVDRLLLLISLIVPSMVYMIGPGRISNLETVFLCLYRSQRTNWTNITISLLNKHAPDVFPIKIFFIASGMEIVNAILDIIGNGLESYVLQWIGWGFGLGMYLCSFVLMAVYAQDVYHRHTDLIRNWKILQWIQNMSHDEYSTFAIVLGASNSIAGTLLTPLALFGSMVLVRNFTVAYLIQYYTFFSLFVVIIAMLPGRSAKFDADLLQGSLDMKRTFVRYVSHEIRTPLNIVYVGLELLETELKEKYPDSDMATDTAQLRESCLIAVEILNDLLQYEKMESGLMKLEVQQVLAIPFIEKVISPFLIQAEAKGISLRILQESDASIDSIKENIFVSIDKMKMSQVLRNFISNAIKVTNTSPGFRVDSCANNSSHRRVER